ncbi:MAG: hypothetical protein LBJ80_01455 [Rickettsiales bacterium]|nr:hypothetical protein [Rickettsiales bacterium]MDR1261074.1 hypothetical protein [Rickettsiales bacterium]
MAGAIKGVTQGIATNVKSIPPKKLLLTLSERENIREISDKLQRKHKPITNIIYSNTSTKTGDCV